MSIAEHRSDRGRLDMQEVVFDLPSDPDHDFTCEVLWAERLGPDRYALKSIPFFVYGVGLEDVVEAVRRSGRPHFVRVTEHSGHSTYRAFVTEGSEDASAAIRSRLESMGCSFDEGGSLWFAVDVPPSTDIIAAYALLEEGEARGVWTFEEGHCGHPIEERGDGGGREEID